MLVQDYIISTHKDYVQSYMFGSHAWVSDLQDRREYLDISCSRCGKAVCRVLYCISTTGSLGSSKEIPFLSRYNSKYP